MIPSAVDVVSHKSIMNEPLTVLLAADYLAALRFHVEHGSQATMQAAQEFGQAALKHGFETLKLAKIHEQALAALLAVEPSPVAQIELARKAAAFFAESCMPIERTHDAARAVTADLEQLNSSLTQRIIDLAASKRDLKVQVDERKAAEAALRISVHSSSQLLQDSQLLEQHLQEMARKILFASENERRVMSLRLNDEIAQTLLGINIRMIALKSEIAANHVNHDLEITNIQKLVDDSSEMIKRLAYEFSVKHP